MAKSDGASCKNNAIQVAKLHSQVDDFIDFPVLVFGGVLPSRTKLLPVIYNLQETNND